MSIPTKPNRAPRTPRRPVAIPAAFAAGGLIIGGLFTGLIVNANNQARIDHCVAALETSGEAMSTAADAIGYAGTFNISGLESTTEKINDLNSPSFREDVTECGGNA